MHATRIQIRGNDEWLTLLGHGVFSSVFTDAPGKRVYKLFRSRESDPCLSTAKRAMTFVYELQAHVRAKAEPELRAYVPEFFGNRTAVAALGEDGSDLSRFYMLDCCIVLERIHGGGDASFQKLNIYSNRKHVRRMTKLLKKHKINYLADASLFYPEDPDRIKVIDFAVKDAHDDSWIP